MWSGSKDIARDAGYDLRRRARAVRPVCCNTHIIPMNVNAVYPRLSKTIGDGIGASCASGYARCNWSGKLATTHLDQIQSNISIFLAYTVNGNNEGWLPAQELFEIFCPGRAEIARMILLRVATPVGRVPGIKQTEPSVATNTICDRSTLGRANKPGPILKTEVEQSFKSVIFSEV